MLDGHQWMTARDNTRVVVRLDTPFGVSWPQGFQFRLMQQRAGLQVERAGLGWGRPTTALMTARRRAARHCKGFRLGGWARANATRQRG